MEQVQAQHLGLRDADADAAQEIGLLVDRRRAVPVRRVTAPVPLDPADDDGRARPLAKDLVDALAEAAHRLPLLALQPALRKDQHTFAALQGRDRLLNLL